MKRILSINLMLILLLLISGFVWLQPMSGNFLSYLVWQYTTNTESKSGYLVYQDVNIHYQVYGHGEPVLLLHGGLSHKLCWFSQLPWLVNTGRQVILLDTRGHGYSTRGNQVLSYQVFAEDALAMLDKLAIKRTDIIGWSDGGITALFMAMNAPERVNRIVAISANFNPEGLVIEDDRPENTEDTLFSQLDDLLQAQIKNWFHPWWSGAGDRHAELSVELEQLWRTQPQLTFNDLNRIAAPTLVIAGENDLIALPHSGDLAQHLAHGQIEIVLGAGHASPFTNTNQINQLIAAFLNTSKAD